MKKLQKIYYDFDVYIQKHPSKFLIGLFILFVIAIIL
jgi:hypothetical protein